MQEQDDNTTNETEAKPTITIAEKQGSEAGDAVKPTITIAEKDSDETSADAKPTITIAEREEGGE